MPKRDSHGDEGESKGQGGGEDDLLAKAIKHCWSDNFLDVFRAYFRKHAEVFEVMADGKSEEHALEYQELFNEYLLIFEGKLEEFIEREGSTINDFYNVIRDHQTNPDPQVQLFINCLLASADYDSFFNVMKKEAEKSLRKKRQLGQESKPTAGSEGKESDSVPRGGVPSTGEGKYSEDDRRHSGERSYK
ncbi:unnamed protein product [Ectocarpus sp. 8 AP-2014]